MQSILVFLTLPLTQNKRARLMILAGAFVSLFLLTMTNALAYTPVCTPKVVYPANQYTVKIDLGVPEGEVAGKAAFYWKITPFNPECITLITWYHINRDTTWSITGEGVPNGNLYPTMISGLSYRIKYESLVDTQFIGKYAPFIVDKLYYDAERQHSAGGHNMLIEYVRTGPISGNTSVLHSGAILHIEMEGLKLMDVFAGGQFAPEIIQPACTITASVIDVPLNPTNQVNLNGFGKTSDDKPFNLPVYCKETRNVQVEFSGTTYNANIGVFSNESSNSANVSQVGIQLLSSNQPVKIGKVSLGNGINLGRVTGNYSVPLSARYYSLSNNVAVGEVSATIYATIVYN